jgi:multidrug efflux pump subunit AcrA (membrane-fusion protein)
MSEITPEHARAIARGDAGFTSATTVVGDDREGRAMRIAYMFGIIAVLSTLAVVAFTFFRGWERRSFDRATAVLTEALTVAERRVVELQDEVQALRNDLAETKADLECRAAANLETDRLEAELSIIQAEQFATTIDQVPPPPDPAVVAAAANALRESLRVRAETVAGC